MKKISHISIFFFCSTLAISVEVAANPIIISVGDSITRGFSTQKSYREEFSRRLDDSGCVPTMRGGATAPSTAHPEDHEGYSGHRADHFELALGSNPGITMIMNEFSNTSVGLVDAVVMHLGTNDILRGDSVSSTLTEIQNVIDLIHVPPNENTPIYIANVVPWYDIDTDGDNILDAPNFNMDALSAGIDNNYSNYSGAGPVYLVDVRTGFRPTDMVSDGIHPSPEIIDTPPNNDPNRPDRSDSGEHHLAVAFAAALEAQGTCNPTSADSAFPLTNILTPVLDETVNGSLTITGKATDTGDAGGDEFDRVRLAIQDNNFTSGNDRWWNFNNELFGSFDSTELWPERTRFTVVGSVSTCNGLNVTVDFNLGQTPTSGPDVVLGTPGPDEIRGKGGDDTICGMGGDDFINGNGGDDWIDGGEGVDNLRGGGGNDIIFTGPGATVGTASTVDGGTGDDEIHGGVDADVIMGGVNRDTIFGGDGDDVIRGNGSFDTISGGDGDDDIRGNAGNDVLTGGAGNDVVHGGSGNNDMCDGGGQSGDTQTQCE